jgi:catechol 2,3-dioxygenase-like lactoylglutathione lyase family enzyme
MLQQSPIFAYIPVRDMARARKFYEEKLGFKPSRMIEGGAHFDCGNGTGFFMYPTPFAGTSRASQAFWSVSDLRAEMAELRAKGVVFEEYDMPGLKTVDGIATGGGAMTAWFKDPDGNILAIAQTIQPS